MTVDPWALRLRELRELCGLTQQQVAEQLGLLAWKRKGRRVGVNADMVSKWERGQKRPSPLYRELIQLLYCAPAQPLGGDSALTASSLTGPPRRTIGSPFAPQT